MLYSDIIDQRELLDFSQNLSVQRDYLGNQLFPDRKTQYIEQEFYRLCENGNLPVAALVHALDTEAVITSRVPFERVRIEELLIKHKINVSERMRKVLRGLSMSASDVRDFVFDDVARLSEGVIARVELAKMDALSKGKFTIAENNLSFDVDYGVPASNFVSSDWSDDDADILGDLRSWRALARAKGQTPNLAVTSDAILSCMQKNTNIQAALFGTSGTGIIPTLDQINTLLRDQVGITLVTNEEHYGIMTADNGDVTVSQGRFFPEDKFVMVTIGAGGALGTGLWGVTPEEEETDPKYDVSHRNQYVTVMSWDTPDPVATWTKASGLFVPVMPNTNGHIIATINTVDDSEG